MSSSTARDTQTLSQKKNSIPVCHLSGIYTRGSGIYPLATKDSLKSLVYIFIALWTPHYILKLHSACVRVWTCACVCVYMCVHRNSQIGTAYSITACGKHPGNRQQPITISNITHLPLTQPPWDIRYETRSLWSGEMKPSKREGKGEHQGNAAGLLEVSMIVLSTTATTSVPYQSLTTFLSSPPASVESITLPKGLSSVTPLKL